MTLIFIIDTNKSLLQKKKKQYFNSLKLYKLDLSYMWIW